MIRTIARLRAIGHHPRPLLAALAAAAATVAAACGTYGGPGAGPYGPAPSSAPRAHAITTGGPTLTARHTALGTILTTGRGFTVYAFEADQGTRSACFGACAAAWTRPAPWKTSPGCCSPPHRTAPPSSTASRRPANYDQHHQQQSAPIADWREVRGQSFAELRSIKPR